MMTMSAIVKTITYTSSTIGSFIAWRPIETETKWFLKENGTFVTASNIEN